MPSLTSLPLFLQSRILSYLIDHQILLYRSEIYATNYYIPYRHPDPQITLDGVQTVNAPLPSTLLAPALASPILAAAAQKLLGSATSYLTDLNTEARLALWLTAYAPYVHALSVSDLGHVWQACLPPDQRSRMLEKLCTDTVHLLKQITINHVRLRVLDLVHVPFHESHTLRDPLMTALIATFHTCRNTLKELALPVHLKSNLCARALETVTLPHLTVFAIELNNPQHYRYASLKKSHCLGLQFLRLIKAVDGHAHRLHGLTTLQELRLINMQVISYSNLRDFNCSDGFFGAIKTLRVSMNYPFVRTSFAELRFFSLFNALESLHWTGLPYSFHSGFEKLCKKLKELHLCHHYWITGVQVGAERHKQLDPRHTYLARNAVERSEGKIKTLVTYGEQNSYAVRQISSCCPNLEYISLFVTKVNVHGLRGLIKKCERLIGIEIIIAEEDLGRLCSDDWQRLGKAIPKHHPNLREIAIQTRWRCAEIADPIDVAVNCFLTVVKRIAGRAERLAFRATVQSRTIAQIMNGISRIMDACAAHSEVLSHLEIDLFHSGSIRRLRVDHHVLLETVDKLRSSKEMLVLSQPHLRKIDLGIWHRFLTLNKAEDQ